MANEKLGRLVISESRGAYAAGVYTDSQGVPGNSSVCLSGPHEVPGVRPATAWCTSGALALGATQAGRIETAHSLQTCVLPDRNGFGAVTFARGRVGPGVTAVMIKRDDGTVLQATVANGWFLAWWPGATSAALAAVRLASRKSSVIVRVS